MRKPEILISLLLVVILPAIVLHFFPAEQPNKQEPASEITVTEKTSSEDNLPKQIRILQNSQVHTVPLDDYIYGVVLGEMPETFHEEALKAQAVAVRTYTLKMLQNTRKHVDADLCTDPSCCQAYVQTDGDIVKVRQAVDSTIGQVLIYDGKLIDATYYSCSGGRTEAAVAVWGTDIPYLQAVDSPWEESAKYHTDTVVFTQKELIEKLGLSEDSDSISYSNLKYTDGGGVAEIQICDKKFTGTQLRGLLDLRSTAFTIHIDGEQIRFDTKGYGHRVGMSQYGADAMAQLGSGYEQILSYYYPQTQLVTLEQNQLSRLFDKAGNL